MKTNYKELQDRMVKLYGLEHPITIAFFSFCERWEENDINIHLLETIVKAHEECPIVGGDEE